MDARRRGLGIAAAVVLAVIGAAILVASTREDATDGRAGPADVYVVTRPVAAGEPAAALLGRVARRRVPRDLRAPGAVDDLRALDGRVAAVDLLEGDQLLEARFVPRGARREGVGRVAVPSGLLEATLALDPERALGGLLRPGDRVTVVASSERAEPFGEPTTRAVLDGVLVTSVQAEARPGATGGFDRRDDSGDADPDVDPAPAGRLYVTLAVDRPALEQVISSAEHGTVWLATSAAA